jgi:hypothetical protein
MRDTFFVQALFFSPRKLSVASFFGSHITHFSLYYRKKEDPDFPILPKETVDYLSRGAIHKISLSPFISGRVATKNDVKYGFFSLVSKTGEEMSIPYDIHIPQEVAHINQETMKRNKGILIQAEKFTKTNMKGQVICTVRMSENSILVCKLEELQLTGKNSGAS